MTAQTVISRGLIGLAMGFGFMWAGSALADTPVPPGPGVTIDVTGVDEPASPDPENNCTGTDPVTCPSLREAIMFANGNAATDGTQTQDTIMVPEGTYVLTIEGADETFEASGDPMVEPTVTNAPDASIGDLDITESVIIVGAGSELTTIQWDAAATTKDRIFHIYDPTEDVFAEISGLSVSNGLLLAETLGEGPPSELGDEPTEWEGMRAGAGIAMGPAAGVSLFDPNKEGDENSAGRGGSQKPDDPGGETGGSYALTLTDVRSSNNNTDGDGGGLYNAGPITANAIVVESNSAGKNGGGIYNEGDSVIEDSTIADNGAEGGGGIFATGNPATSLQIRGTTLSGNTAIGGGAVSGRVVTINLTNSTLSGNIGADVGGGVYSNGKVRLLNCSVVDNEASGAEAFGGAGVNVFNSGNVSLTLINTLLSGNHAGSEEGGREANCGCTGSQAGCVEGVTRKIATLGHNLSDDLSCNLDGTGDLDDVEDAGIGALEDNGGLTLTHALLDGSPAIDAGDDEECPNNDQRGSIRPADGDDDGTKVCDIGAFELFLGYMGLHIENLTAPDDADTGDTVPIAVTVHHTGIEPVTSVELATMISAELSIVEATYNINEGDSSPCTQADNVVTCAIGTMEQDDVAMANIETTAANVGTATIDASVASPDDEGDTASASVVVSGIADMQLDASAEQPTATVGDEMTVTAVVTNNGPDDATSVRVSSELPDGTTFVSATPDTGSCVASDEGLLDCELGDMAADGPSVNVVLVLTADVAGMVDVTMSAGAVETDPDIQNNTNSAEITVDEPSGSSGCGSCTVGATDGGGRILLSLSVLGFLLWRRRRSNMS
ncbi:MAG: DUF11 domain-containing protein [Deltaproteobacteria bacterium]|nr:DUF11 domain-containing protein [Deltaproteobacteria bacterium]